MKKRQIVLISLFFIVVVCSLAARVIDYIAFDVEIIDQQNVYQNAVALYQGYAYSGTASMTGLYTVLLAAVMKMFGMGNVAAVCLNMLLQVIVVIILFLALQKVWNMYISFCLSLIVSFSLLFFGKMYIISSFNLWLVAIVIGVWIAMHLLERFLREREQGIWETKESEQTDEMENTMYQESEGESGVITLEDIIGPIANEDADTSDKAEIEKQKQEQEAHRVFPVGMKEIHLQDLDKKVQYIENPLPTPKRRAHKEMDYAYEIAENDDFDITDMTGMDFYDVE